MSFLLIYIQWWKCWCSFAAVLESDRKQKHCVSKLCLYDKQTFLTGLEECSRQLDCIHSNTIYFRNWINCQFSHAYLHVAILLLLSYLIFHNMIHLNTAFVRTIHTTKHFHKYTMYSKKYYNETQSLAGWKHFSIDIAPTLSIRPRGIISNSIMVFTDLAADTQFADNFQMHDPLLTTCTNVINFHNTLESYLIYLST